MTSRFVLSCARARETELESAMESGNVSTVMSEPQPVLCRTNQPVLFRTNYHQLILHQLLLVEGREEYLLCSRMPAGPQESCQAKTAMASQVCAGVARGNPCEGGRQRQSRTVSVSQQIQSPSLQALVHDKELLTKCNDSLTGKGAQLMKYRRPLPSMCF